MVLETLLSENEVYNALNQTMVGNYKEDLKRLEAEGYTCTALVYWNAYNNFYPG
jgi:hypothetical protein